MVVGAAAFGAVVLATSFPASELLSQRQAISSATSEVQRLKSSDRALSAMAARLSRPATVDRLARQEFGLVEPGVKVYSIEPPSGSQPGAGLGPSPLTTPPVLPGGFGGSAPTGGGPATGSGSGSSASDSGSGSPSGSTGKTSGSGSSGGTGAHEGLLGRVIHTLEFWR